MFFKDTDVLGFKQETRDLLRGISGGAIFGMPLLYTMEIWMNGRLFSSLLLILILVLTLALNICFSYFAGLREKNMDNQIYSAIDDGVTSMALGLVLAFFILFFIGRLDLGPGAILGSLGKIVLEACIISVGITFTNFKFKSHKQERSLPLPSRLTLSPSARQLRKDLNDFAATMAGAFVYTFNVAPTEEVILIASELSPLQLIPLLAAEVFLCYIILFASGLGKNEVYEKDSFFQKPLSEMILCTSISLSISAGLLALLGYGGLQVTDSLFLPAVVTLGLPAVVGGAAGRLVV
jgi:putative integral membrane protein (TIGR02587 family)